ncbi:MAG: DUF2062 domain-containing protein [Vicinamibacterales bacterium]
MVRRWLEALLHVHDTPERTAAAYALGVFLGFSPFLGLHTIVAIALAFIFSLNRVAVLLGVYSNLPWILVPYYAFATAVGAFILRTETPEDFCANGSRRCSSSPSGTRSSGTRSRGSSVRSSGPTRSGRCWAPRCSPSSRIESPWSSSSAAGVISHYTARRQDITADTASAVVAHLVQRRVPARIGSWTTAAVEAQTLAFHQDGQVRIPSSLMLLESPVRSGGKHSSGRSPRRSSWGCSVSRCSIRDT